MADEQNTGVGVADEATNETGGDGGSAPIRLPIIHQGRVFGNGAEILNVSIGEKAVSDLESVKVKAGSYVVIKGKNLNKFDSVALRILGQPKPVLNSQIFEGQISFAIPNYDKSLDAGGTLLIELDSFFEPQFNCRLGNNLNYKTEEQDEEEEKEEKKQAEKAQKKAEEAQKSSKNLDSILERNTPSGLAGVFASSGGESAGGWQKQMLQAMADDNKPEIRRLALEANEEDLKELSKQTNSQAHKDLLQQTLRFEEVTKSGVFAGSWGKRIKQAIKSNNQRDISRLAKEARPEELEELLKKLDKFLDPEHKKTLNNQLKQFNEQIESAKKEAQASELAKSQDGLDDDDRAAQAELIDEKNITGLGGEVSAGGTQTIGGQTISQQGTVQTFGGSSVGQTSTGQARGSQTFSTQGTVTASGQQTISQSATVQGGGQTASGGTAQAGGSQKVSSAATVSGQVSAGKTVSATQTANLSGGSTGQANAKVTAQAGSNGQANANVSGQFKPQAQSSTLASANQVGSGQTAGLGAQNQALGTKPQKAEQTVSQGQTQKTPGQISSQGQTGISGQIQKSTDIKSPQQFSGSTAGGGGIVNISPKTTLGAFSLPTSQGTNIAGVIPKKQQPSESPQQKKDQEIKAQEGNKQSAGQKEPEDKQEGVEKPKEQKNSEEKEEDVKAAETPEGKKAGQEIMANLDKQPANLQSELERAAGPKDKKSRLPRKQKKELQKSRQAQNIGSSGLAGNVPQGTEEESAQKEPTGGSKQLGQNNLSEPPEPGESKQQEALGGEPVQNLAQPNQPGQEKEKQEEESQAEEEDLEPPRVPPQVAALQESQRQDQLTPELEPFVKLVNQEIDGFLIGGVGWVFGLMLPTFGLSLIVGAIAGDLIWLFKGLVKSLAKRFIKSIPSIPEKIKENSQALVSQINLTLKIKIIIVLLNIICLVVTLLILDFFIYVGCNSPIPSNPATKYYGSYLGIAGYSDVCETFLKAGNQVFDRPANPSGPAIQGVNTQSPAETGGVNAR
jgi:hypothetical protein